MNVYQDGSKVRINRESDPHWHGKIGTIIGRSAYGSVYMLNVEGEVNACWFSESQLQPADLTNVTHGEMPTPDEIIADLTDQLYQASKEVDRYSNMYLTDMVHWENTMRDVKDRQGWCDEGTNKIIGELNQGFIGWQLDYYEQEFEIEVEVMATISTRVTVTVSATSEELAAEYVLDDPTSYLNPYEELAAEVPYCDYDVDLA